MNYIELAKQATGGPVWNGMEWLLEELQKFADLVEAAARADEREECAKLCDEQANSEYWEGAYACGRNIRARGEA